MHLVYMMSTYIAHVVASFQLFFVFGIPPPPRAFFIITYCYCIIILLLSCVASGVCLPDVETSVSRPSPPLGGQRNVNLVDLVYCCSGDEDPFMPPSRAHPSSTDLFDGLIRYYIDLVPIETSVRSVPVYYTCLLGSGEFNPEVSLCEMHRCVDLSPHYGRRMP